VLARSGIETRPSGDVAPGGAGRKRRRSQAHVRPSARQRRLPDQPAPWWDTSVTSSSLLTAITER
jgi:hypothetical protein